jgi:hypothetical protein
MLKLIALVCANSKDLKEGKKGRMPRLIALVCARFSTI